MGGRLSVTRHICVNKYTSTFYNVVGDGEKLAYLGDSQNAPLLGNEKVLLKLTSGKALAFTYVLHVTHIRANMILVAPLIKECVKVPFKS